VSWIFGLKPVLEEAVAKVLLAPVILSEHGMFLYRLKESDLPTDCPAQVALLLRHILVNAPELGFDCDSVDRVTRVLLGSGADKALLSDICEHMARLGCPTASPLSDLVAGS